MARSQVPKQSGPKGRSLAPAKGTRENMILLFTLVVVAHVNFRKFPAVSQQDVSVAHNVFSRSD